MRTYIRHPADIPVQVEIKSQPAQAQRRVSNVSYGGLAFLADGCMDRGTQIRIRIEVVDPAFEAEGIVTYCRQKGRRIRQSRIIADNGAATSRRR